MHICSTISILTNTQTWEAVVNACMYICIHMSSQVRDTGLPLKKKYRSRWKNRENNTDLSGKRLTWHPWSGMHLHNVNVCVFMSVSASVRETQHTFNCGSVMCIYVCMYVHVCMYEYFLSCVFHLFCSRSSPALFETEWQKEADSDYSWSQLRTGWS